MSVANAPHPQTGALGSGSPRLDISTSYDHGAILYRYPCGAVEVVCNPKTTDFPHRDRVTTPDKARDRGVEVARRAATQFRRAALAADLRYLLTTTYRENLLDYPSSKGHIQAVLRGLRRRHSGLRYVGAPEMQKRGAWHWHVLLDRRIEAAEVRELWRDQVGDGNIDLQHFRDPVRGALYAAKYVRKGFGEFRVPGVRYLRSRNIEVQCEKATQSAAYEFLAAGGWSGEVFALDTGGWWAASWR